MRTELVRPVCPVDSPADPLVTVRGALGQDDGDAVWATVATVYAGFLRGDAAPSTRCSTST